MAKHRRFRAGGQLISMTAVLSIVTVPTGGVGPDFIDTSARPEVALELVLAIDSSTSVSDEEFRLQRQGLATAFRDPGICRAIGLAGPGGVAVAVTQWSNASDQVLAVDWTLLLDEPDCEAFAEQLERMQRRLVGGTVISGAIDFARRQILESSLPSRRAVIDLSGDGPDRHGVAPALARDRAVDAGITINALAIMTGRHRLDEYLKSNVIGGPGAFVMTASGYEDFASAMREKLIREISRPSVASQPMQGAGEVPSRRVAGSWCGMTRSPTPDWPCSERLLCTATRIPT